MIRTAGTKIVKEFARAFVCATGVFLSFDLIQHYTSFNVTPETALTLVVVLFILK